MSKHTPGPWFVDSSRHFDTRIKQKVDDDVTIVVMGNWQPQFSDEQRANAHLIAAAPEMYEALIEARYLLIKRALQESTTFGLVNTAIAKAEGRP